MTNQTIQQPKKSRIPDFKNRQEMAEFWDTHSVADYLDELTPVKIKFAKNLSEGLNIRFDPGTLAEIRKQAQEKGVGPTTLVYANGNQGHLLLTNSTRYIKRISLCYSKNHTICY